MVVKIFSYTIWPDLFISFLFSFLSFFFLLLFSFFGRYIYIHTIAPWKNLVAVEMVNRPLGLVFRFSKPSHHFHEHIYSNVEQKDTIVTLLEGA